MNTVNSDQSGYQGILYTPNGEELPSVVSLVSTTEQGFIEAMAAKIKEENERTSESRKEILDKITSEKPFYVEISGKGCSPFKMFLTPDKIKKIANLI